MKRLWRFKGGIKLPGHKKLSNNTGIKFPPIPEKLILPLRQHIGEAAKPVVNIGDKVFKGQLIADSHSFISAPVHASSSGTIANIGSYKIPHISGIAETAIVIETDGLDQWHPDINVNQNPEALTKEQLRNLIKNAGVVGLGGAVFPSAAKLKPTRMIDTLIINGVECEPYITCDDLLMRSRAKNIIEGIFILRKLLNPVECIIAIEDNKPEAIEAIKNALAFFKSNDVGIANTVEVITVPTLFPAGGEKQLVKVLTGKEVPQNGLPYEVGVVCLNVGTTAAIYDAVHLNRPLISRLVTVTGPGIKHPANFDVLLGTPVENLLQAAGGVLDEQCKLIMGGPMMGQILPDNRVPIIKASNCILVQQPPQTKSMPCIRCGACTAACPMHLLPQQLYWHARGKIFDKLEHYHLGDCIECGCCSVVCPSKIPLVHYFRFAKTEKREHDEKALFATQSRVRTLAREARLERIKHEQEEKKAQRRLARQKKKQSETSAEAKPEPQQTSLE